MKALAFAGLRSVGSSVQRDAGAGAVGGDGVGLRRRVAAGVAGGLRAGGGAVGERGGDAPEAAAGAGDVHGLGLLAGQEGLERLVPGEACPWCGRRGAGRASSRRTSARRRRRCRAAAPALPFSMRLTRSDFTRRRPVVPVTVRPSSASMPRARARSVSAGSTAGRTSTMTAGFAPASARSKAAYQAAVVGGDDRRAVADLDAVAVEVGLGGAGQHHAGAVVAVEDQRLLERALGEDDLRWRAPSTSARGGRRRAGVARWSVRRWARPTRFWW